MKHIKLQLDATGKSIGRLATEVAIALEGKHRPDYQANVDSGDFVEIRNASKLVIKGKKLEQKNYYHYSGYPGGMAVKTLKEVMAKNPGDAIKRAVKNMLPKNRMQIIRLKRLTVFND